MTLLDLKKVIEETLEKCDKENIRIETVLIRDEDSDSIFSEVKYNESSNTIDFYLT